MALPSSFGGERRDAHFGRSSLARLKLFVGVAIDHQYRDTPPPNGR
jgi:hypothetical protein